MKKKVNKQFYKYKVQAEIEKNEGGITDETRIKLKKAKIDKIALENIRTYAEKTIKEIDPSSYKSNAGRRLVKALFFTSPLSLILDSIHGENPKYLSSVGQDIARFADEEKRRAEEKKLKLNKRR